MTIILVTFFLQSIANAQTDSFEIELISKTPLKQCQTINVKNSIAYIGTDSLFFIGDITNPKKPEIISSYHLPSSAIEIVIKDSIAFILCEKSGLRIIDISEHHLPKEINQFPEDKTTLSYNDLFIADTLAYINDSFGITILNISDLSALRQLSLIPKSSFRSVGDPTHLAVKDHFCYVGVYWVDEVVDSFSDIYVVDVSDLENPGEPMWQTGLGEGVECMTINDNFLYVCDYSSGFYIFDISNTSDEIKLIGRVDYLSDKYGGIVISNDFAFISSRDRGLIVIDLSDKHNPKEISSYYIDHGTCSIFIEDSYIYLCNWIWQAGNFIILKFDELSGIKETLNNYLMNTFLLYQNYPNPFNPTTTLRYNIHKSSNVMLNVYNLSGQELEKLVNSYQTAGEYEITWQPKGLPSGIYFYKLQTGKSSETKKLIFQK